VGKRSADIEAILGYNGGDELVHRNDMALSRK
jgi:glutamate 5-kinase